MFPAQAGQSEEPQTTLRRWFLLGRVAATIAIFAVILWKVDFAHCARAIREADIVWYSLAFAACSIGYITSTMKWDCALRGIGVIVSRWALLKIYLIGSFVGAALPGTIGGDVVRVRLVGASTGGYVNVAASILIERLTGMTMLILMASVAVASDIDRLGKTVVLTLVGCAAAGLIVGLSVILNRRLAAGLAYRVRRKRLGRVVYVLYRIQRVLRRFPRLPLLVAFLWSVFFYLGIGLLLFLSCLAFGASIRFTEATSVAVLVSLLMLIPISLGGLGLRQAGDVYVLGLLGIDPGQALAVSLGRQVITYAYVVAGGALFLRCRGLTEQPEKMGPGARREVPQC